MAMGHILGGFIVAEMVFLLVSLYQPNGSERFSENFPGHGSLR